MTTIDVSSEKLRRNQALALGIKIVAAVIVLATFVLSYVTLLFAIRNLTEQGRQNDCRQQLLAYVFQDVAKAFNTPPSPNGPRVAAVNDINLAADRYADADRVCAADLTPAPLPPTPVPTTQGATP
jgi:hypothetical protein